MDAHCCRLLLLLCCLSAQPGLGQLYPPTNITFGMNGMFCLFWKWTPTDSAASCSLSYITEILPSAKPPRGKDKNPYYTKFLDNRIDLNKDVTLKVATQCNDATSDFTSFTSPLAPGNPRTMVRNMTCIWHYKEYVNCTWKPGEDPPLGVHYSLRYWLTDDTVCPPAEEKQPRPLLDLLDDGEPCQHYTYQSGIPVGCRFKLEKNFSDFSNLVAVVTDGSQNIKPYIYFVCVNSIATFKPPVIHEMKRIPNNILFVSWNVSNTPIEAVIYEVQLQMSNTEKIIDQEVSSGQSLEFPNVHPDVTYTVKVRVKFHQQVLCLPDEQLKSDWSEESVLKAIQDKTTVYLVLLLIPIVIIVGTVLLLINMRRLMNLICPEIPDPSKVISSDFQQWLKYGKRVYNEPKKEEVCLVSLLEPLPSSSKAE